MFDKKIIVFGFALIFLGIFMSAAEARYTLYDRYGYGYAPVEYAVPSGYYYQPYQPSTYFQMDYYNKGSYYSFGYGEMNLDRYYGDFLTVSPNYNWYANMGYGYYGYGGYYYDGCGYYSGCYRSRIFYPACIGYFCYS